MDELLKLVKEKRKVRDLTLDSYRQALDRLSMTMTEQRYVSNEFLRTMYKDISQFLREKSTSVAKRYLSAILVALSPTGVNEVSPKNEDVYNKYKAILMENQLKYMKTIENGAKSENDKKRWTSWSSIEKVQESLRKELNGIDKSMSRYGKVFSDYVMVSLYVLLPPRRLDFANARLIDSKGYKILSRENLENNIYYVITTKPFFHFGKNAVKSETEENETIDVPTKLKNILSKYIKYKRANAKEPVIYLFGKITKNLLGKQLSRIFAEHGLPRGISVSMLRKIYLTDHHSNKVKQIVDAEMKSIAKKMNHSSSIQQSIYTKKSED